MPMLCDSYVWIQYIQLHNILVLKWKRTIKNGLVAHLLFEGSLFLSGVWMDGVFTLVQDICVSVKLHQETVSWKKLKRKLH